MKAIKKIISTVVVLCLCISMSAITAFADRGKYEKLGYLTADEVFERTWDCILTSRGTEHEQKSGDTTELSYEYSKYSDFMKNFDIKSNEDLKIVDVCNQFYEYLNNLGFKIVPYSKTIVNYLSENPNADLQWTYINSKDEYEVWDKSNLIDTYSSNVYMQYKPNDVSDILIWTYDESKDKYICKNQNGKTVDSVIKYHLENESSNGNSKLSEESSRQKSSVSSSSSTEASTDYTVRADEDVEGVAVPDSEETDTDTDTDMVTNEAAEEDGAVDEDDPEPVTEDNTVSNSTNHAKVTGELEEEVTADEFLPDIAEEPENSNNNIQQILLIIIGILILAGIVVIIVMLRKRKAEEKNEK